MKIKRNICKERCLVCCREETISSRHIALLISAGYEVEVVRSRLDAMRAFMARKHSLLLIESLFLPAHAQRLIQLFKLAHRTPAVLYLAPEISNVFTYLYNETLTSGEFVETPVAHKELALGIKRVSQRLKVTGRKLFLYDLLIFCTLGLPIGVVLLVLLLLR